MLHRFLAFHRARVAIRVPVQSETKVLRAGMQYLTLASALAGRDPSTPRMLSMHLDCVRGMEDLLVRRVCGVLLNASVTGGGLVEVGGGGRGRVGCRWVFFVSCIAGVGTRTFQDNTQGRGVARPSLRCVCSQ